MRVFVMVMYIVKIEGLAKGGTDECNGYMRKSVYLKGNPTPHLPDCRDATASSK
jgi:hypothetical protein